MHIITARAASPTSIYSISERQVGVGGSGLDSLGFDDGQYDPTPVSASAIEEAGEIYSSLDTNSMTTEDLDVATTSAVTGVNSASLVASSTVSDPSSTASPSASPTVSNGSNLASNGDNGGGVRFHITYLIPLFVIVGLVLVFAVGGKIWGRIAYSKERALRRKTRQERQIIREQRKEKKERAERIRRQWEQNGWGESMSPDASFEKQHLDENGEASESEIDESEDELKGPLSAIGTHLAGVKRGRPLPPARRIEQGRYGAKVEANNWLGTQWRRNFEQDDRRGGYIQPCQMITPSDLGSDAPKRATLRGTWERVKLRITENIGWGYDGNTPDFNQRKQIVATASSSNHLWTRVPLDNSDLPHTRSGLLLPPQLGEDGYPIVMPDLSSSRPKKSLFPLSGRNREGSYSPPVLKAPPNTIKALPPSNSKTTLSSVKDIFTAFRGKSSQSLADSAGRGRHERIQNVADEWDEKPAYVTHSHPDGKKCSLDEPQYLPPMRTGSHRDMRDSNEVLQQSSLLQAPAPLCRSPTKMSASIHRQPSSLGSNQVIRPRTLSARKRRPSAERESKEQPTSIMRNKSNRSMAMSRSSTVRFTTDAGDSSAASFILNYSDVRTPRTDAGSDYEDDDDDDEEEDETVVSPTRRLSRARTTAGQRRIDDKDQPVRRYKSVIEKTASFSSLSKSQKGSSKDDPFRSQSRIQSRSEMQRSHSIKSSKSYTESVKFGDEDEGMNEKTFIPAVDSRLLTRTRTRKGGLSSLALNEVAANREETNSEQGIVVMDLSRQDLSIRDENHVPALSSGTSSTGSGSDELESGNDIESEIDSALLSLIARSNTSKSYYHPFPAIDSPRAPANDTPTMGTPIGRKRTWREKNGKWERLSREEIEALDREQEQEGQGTPGKAFSYTASPPPLPPPPVWNQQQQYSPTRSTMALPSSLALASRDLSAMMSPDSVYSRPSPMSPPKRGGGDLFIVPPTLYHHTKSRSLSPVKNNPILSPSDYGDNGEGEEEEDQEENGSAIDAPSRSTLSSHSTRSEQTSASSNTTTSTTSTSPKRRTAMAKRVARPLRHYQAKLGGEEDEESHNSRNKNTRLHTGKSLRTPAEKEQERQFAMDRVQSIVTKGHARRQQSS